MIAKITLYKMQQPDLCPWLWKKANSPWKCRHDSSYPSVLEIVVLADSLGNLPGAAHALGEHNQVAGAKLHEIRGPFRVHLHLAFQKVARLRAVVGPWKRAGLAPPPA
jgi:hypothetical protein